MVVATQCNVWIMVFGVYSFQTWKRALNIKFEFKGPNGEGLPHKADPWGFYSEQYPSFSSVTYDHACYEWQDANGKTAQWQRSVKKHCRSMSYMLVMEAQCWRWVLKLSRACGRAYPIPNGAWSTHVERNASFRAPVLWSMGLLQPVGLFAPEPAALVHRMTSNTS